LTRQVPDLIFIETDRQPQFLKFGKEAVFCTGLHLKFAIYNRFFNPCFMNIKLLLQAVAQNIKSSWAFLRSFAVRQLRIVYPHLHDMFSVLRCIWFHFLMLGVGYFALTSTEQARDMLYVFTDAIAGGVRGISENFWLLSFFFAGIFWWSFVMWFTSRLILKSSHIRLIFKKWETRGTTRVNAAAWHIRFIIRYFPRLSGALPFLFVMIGTLSLTTKATFTIVLFGILTIASFLFYTFRARLQEYFFSRKWVIKRFGAERTKQFKADPDRFETQRQPLSVGGKLVAAIAFTVTTVLFLLLCLIKDPVLPQTIGPHGLILSALGGWTVFGSLLVLYSNRYRIPGILLLLIYTVMVSRCNNNHSVRTTTRLAHVDERETLEQRIEGWMQAFVADSTISGTDSSSTGEIPVIVVASQGGGIRAMNWTVRVLNQLNNEKALPNFYRHVFALSGVSGGSVGIAVHTAYMRDSVSNTNGLNKVISSDYLSPVTAGLLYPDMVQKFLWWPRESFDRARRLEDAWSECYKDTLNSNRLDADFLSLWKSKAATNYTIPSLFLNSVVAESGQKAIISNIQLDQHYFPDAIDVIHETGYDMPLKSAALCSARFPFVTPGGLVQLTGADAGHLIDGGYLENTGMVTGLSIICAINDYINDSTPGKKHIPKHIKKRLRPVLLFIQNADFGASAIHPLTLMHELSVPPSGFINSWDREGVALDQQMKLLTERLSPKVSYIKFELDRNQVPIPLSWYISKTADAEVSRQTKGLNTLGPNKEAYTDLCQLFAENRKR
jgi:hypothetical protein